MTKGKVVLVPFPFDDLSGAKLRPAVCLTDPVGPHRHVVVAFITSNTATPRLATDLTLAPTHPDFGATGLRVPSVLRLHRLLTISTGIIQRELGRMSEPLRTELICRLIALFGLTAPETAASHDHLWTLVAKLPTDFTPWGERDRDIDEGPDCSCGCKHFHPLAGARGNDWGICTNAISPRSALLTFEHMGCKAFEAAPRLGMSND